MVDIEKITEYTFVYRPFNKDFPIHSVAVTIRARSRKEAELINLANNYKFFNEDCTIIVMEVADGFRTISGT